ncbi:aldo/keto reductase [Limibacter armeniacum]|uniref:aldo/keto reductase n=1 Tax=Limibacter armeniacum TaxID=466084 RepID=UPI002FE5C9EA
MISTAVKPVYKQDIYQDNDAFSHGSRLVLGTSGLGGVWGPVDEQESIDCILYALENGILSMDSAPSYSRAEAFLGKALRQWKGEKPYISTKVGRLVAEKADEYHLDYTHEGMIRSVECSLETIGVEQVDLLFLHEPHLVPFERKDEIIETLRYIKEKGWARKIGVGGNPVDEFYPFLDSGLFEVVSGFTKMDACNMSAFEKDIPYFQQKGIAYYAASALHMGLLGRRYEEYCEQRPNNEWISNRDVDVAIKVKPIADELGIDIAELGLRYVLSVKEADRVVIGARKSYQVQNTIDFWQKGALSEEIFQKITDAIYH